jgi:DNA-binding CsgD family transcriptional regulator
MNIDVARREQILELHRQGLSRRKIAEKMGMKPSSVYYEINPDKAKSRATRTPSRNPRHEEIVQLSQQGLTRPQIANLLGVGERTVRRALEREATEEAARESVQPINWETLPGSMKDKLEVMRRQVQRKLEAEFEAAVIAEVQGRMEYAIKAVERRERDANRVIEGRKGIFTATQYRVIRACLHPDGRESVSPERLSEAFRLFNEADVLLMNNKELPMESSLPPIEELLKRRKRKMA